jgi:adenylate cyclase
MPMSKKRVACLALSALVLSAYSAGLVNLHRERFNLASDERNQTLNFLNTFEWFWYDFKFRNRRPERAQGVVVAKIDDASLERFGRWPWNRAVYKEILDYLYDLGAEVVGFDAVFSEPEIQKRYLRESLVSEVLGRQEKLSSELKLDENQISGLVENLPIVGDQIFASAVFQHPKTVLGYFWQDTPSACRLYDPANPRDKAASGGQALTREQALQAGLLHVDEFVDDLGSVQNIGIEAGQKPFVVQDPATRALLMYCPVTNRSVLSAKAKYQGYFNSISDTDGLFRRVPLVLGFAADFVPVTSRDFLPTEWFQQATFFPSLSIEALVAYWNSPGARIEWRPSKTGHGPSEIAAVVIPRPGQGDVRIETLPDGSIPLNFYGSQAVKDKPIPEISLANLTQDLRSPANAAWKWDKDKPLKGQIVIIGPTALGVYDLRPSPVQGNAPGVFLHAATISRILEQARGEGVSPSMRFASLGLSEILLWSIGLGVAVILLFSNALQGLMVSMSCIVLFLALDVYLFFVHAFVLDAMSISLALLSVSAAIYAYKHFTEERERAFVKGAFEKYVSPDLVSSILKDPKSLNLGGQKRELTVLFSDIRGFTTLSEKLNATDLAQFMNEYLTPMTDLVLEHKGTIDKYMGDAIMAIFGAPVHYSEHATHAVDAALDMLARLEELKKGWAERGLPPVEIGIGINTGDMSVGNMGSTRIFSYTVMGDSVNLGSRLEGLNKEYATHLIVSEFTRKNLGPEYLCRELDRVRVKGKQIPVTIFEVLGRDQDQDRKIMVQRFEAALALYYKAHFLEAMALFQGLGGEDPVAKLYQRRCELWLEEPPESSWDGSWTMKTK